MTTRLTKRHRLILKAELCPYCGSDTIRVDQKHIYGRDFNGKDMICCAKFPECDAYVGTHGDSREPFGRLANKELRELRKEAHRVFDRIWLEKLTSRHKLYGDLTRALKIKRKHCHIGFFNKNTCRKVIKYSEKKYIRMKKSKNR